VPGRPSRSRRLRGSIFTPYYASDLNLGAAQSTHWGPSGARLKEHHLPSPACTPVYRPSDWAGKETKPQLVVRFPGSMHLIDIGRAWLVEDGKDGWDSRACRLATEPLVPPPSPLRRPLKGTRTVEATSEEPQ